VYRQSASRWL